MAARLRSAARVPSGARRGAEPAGPSVTLRPVPPLPSSPTDPPALTAADTAREFTGLARRFTSAFESFAQWSTIEPEARRRRVHSTASRILGAHAAAFAALIPESVLLADGRAAGAAEPIPDAVDATTLLEELDRTIAEMATRATPSADGAFLRCAMHARADLAAIRHAITDADN